MPFFLGQSQYQTGDEGCFDLPPCLELSPRQIALPKGFLKCGKKAGNVVVGDGGRSLKREE